jgi:hypothetical protein
MRTLIPEHLNGKALFEFLTQNKASLINEKKSMLKRTEPVFHTPFINHFKQSANKADQADTNVEGEAGSGNGTMIPDSNVVKVKVVANTCNWCDSQMDVLIADCWKKSIRERKNMIPHLHDHNHTIESKVGEVTAIYSQEMLLTDLGLNLSGSAQALIFETDVMKSYNEKIFNQYKAGKINQHSIGLQYVKIEMAINDSDYEKEMDFWNKYYPLVINKDAVDARGYFWVVTEIKLLENSCVLFGSNEITPTLEVKQSAQGTETPPIETTAKFDLLEAIQKTQFIKI